MSFVTKKHIERRAFLRGAGTALALPFLDAMVPALTAQSKTAAAGTQRAGFIYFPHGAIMKQWTPATEGAGFELSRVLQPLAANKDRLVVLTNLAHHQADSLGDGAADHARAGSTFLNGVHPKRTEGEDVRAGTTIDQLAAQAIGQTTRYPSIEIATEDMTRLVGACDVGYSCTYMNTISWASPTTPLPMEINPRVIFERLFGDSASPKLRAERLAEDRSILDQISHLVPTLKQDLGTRDQARMDDYLDNIREIERRLQIAEQQGGFDLPTPDAPVGVPDTFDEHVTLMYDLMALAFQGDVTRVFAFMMARELSQRSYPQIGVPEPHHSVSHHMDNPEKIEKLVKIQIHYMELFNHFLDKLRATEDGDGNLLDHSMILAGSCLSNSNVHDHDPLPVLLAGGACGKLEGDRHLKYAPQTPMANLLLSSLHKLDIDMDEVGDSTGPLTDL